MSPSNSPSFEDRTENLAEWMRVNGNKVTIALVGVVVVVGGAWLLRSNSARTETRAGTALSQAQQAVITGDATTAQRQLQEVVQRYSSTAAGTEARMQLAELYYDQGKFDDGLKVLKDANGGPDVLKNAVAQLSAVGYEGLNKYSDAAKAYEDVAKSAKTEAERQQLRAAAARALQAGGDKAGALKIWTELSQLEGQGVSDEARVRVGELAANAGK